MGRGKSSTQGVSCVIGMGTGRHTSHVPNRNSVCSQAWAGLIWEGFLEETTFGLLSRESKAVRGGQECPRKLGLGNAAFWDKRRSLEHRRSEVLSRARRFRGSVGAREK